MERANRRNVEGYISVAEAAEKWAVSKRAVQIWIKKDLLEGVAKVGNVFLVPADVERPADGRKKKQPQRIFRNGQEITLSDAIKEVSFKTIWESMDQKVLEATLEKLGVNILSKYLELADKDLIIE